MIRILKTGKSENHSTVYTFSSNSSFRIFNSIWKCIFRVILIAVLIGMTSVSTTAGERSGMHFLRVGVGGRSGGMGEAYSAVARGAEALYWNPAGAAFADGKEILLSHTEWIQEIRGEFLGFAWRSGRHAWGFHAYSHNIGNIEHRVKASKLPLATFGAHDFSGGLTFAKIFGRNGAAGITVKYLYEKIFVDESNGWAIDGGILAPLPVENLTLAVVARNWGSMNEMKNDAITLPSSVRLGLMYDPSLSFSAIKNILMTADYEFIKGAGNFGMAGIEWMVLPQLRVQGGYQFGYAARSVCGGAGILWKQFSIDYGYAPFGVSLGNTHRISLGLRW